MNRTVLLSLALLVPAVGAAAWWWDARHAAPELPTVHAGARIETAPLCPWRDPEKDLSALFPGANGYTTETRILSGSRLELTRRLGHAPSADDNALHLNRVTRGRDALGTVICRRVKGEFGAIELVVGVRPDDAVQGVRLQRMREPETTARLLRSPEWLAGFRGRRIDSRWDTVPAGEAATSAAAVTEGVRTTLILLDEAEHSGLHAPEHHH